MKIKDCFTSETLNDDIVMVSSDIGVFNGLIKANATAAFLLSLLKTDIKEEELVSKVLDKYDISSEKAQEYILIFLDKLRQNNLLDE